MTWGHFLAWQDASWDHYSFGYWLCRLGVSHSLVVPHHEPQALNQPGGTGTGTGTPGIGTPGVGTPIGGIGTPVGGGIHTPLGRTKASSCIALSSLLLACDRQFVMGISG